MIQHNNFSSEEHFNLAILDRCDDASIESLALSEMGSYGLPIHPTVTSSKKNALQHHFSQSCRKNSVGGLSSVLSFGDDDDDDNFTYATESSFRLSHLDGQNQLGKYNDTDLMNMMMKLRGDGEGGGREDRNSHDPSNQLVTGVHDEHSDVNDELIAKHLKALTITTLTMRNTDKKTSSSNRTTRHQSSDDISVVTYGTGLLDLEGSESDSDSDNEEEEEDGDYESDDHDDVDDNNTAYAEVDEVMHRLNTLIRSNPTNIDDSNHGKSGRELLQKLSKQGACDYENAPHTATSKKDWLARLAAELLQEGEIDNELNSYNYDESKHMDDDDVGSVAMSVVEIYNHNVRLLEKEAERAAQLLQKRGAEPTRSSESLEKPLTTTIAAPWKLQPQQQHKPHTTHLTKSSLKQSKRSSDVEPLNRLNPTTKDAQSIRKSTIVSKSETSKIPTQSSLTSDQGTLKSTNNPNAKVPPRSSSSHVARMSKRSDPENPRPLKHHGAATTKTTTTTKPKEYANIVIPSGFPPYPGHGPKWPWHPDSPRAPDGYKECYMLHMGEYYHQYMAYLQQRAASTYMNHNVCTTNRNEEEVLRKALSSQATFKDHMSHATSKSVTSTPPTSTVASPPKSSGRARKNCVVPVVLAKIEEGSNSSSKSSLNNGSKPVKLTTGNPNINIVGKVHPKSKGKRGTIVVVTANELDQKAKEEKKVHRQQLQSKQKSIPALSVSSGNDQGSNKYYKPPNTLQRDMTSTTEVDIINQQCGCTIM